MHILNAILSLGENDTVQLWTARIWAITFVGFLILLLTSNQGPDDPLGPQAVGAIRGGDRYIPEPVREGIAPFQYELPFPSPDEQLGPREGMGVTHPGAEGFHPRWSQTPCGRTTHVRSWSDLH